MTANAAMPEQFSLNRLFVTLLVLIFCIEGAVMFALDDLLPKGIPVWVSATIDAGLLTAITSALVWRLFIRPLRFALLSEAAQGKAITDTAAEGIITSDEHGIIDSLNRAAERMFAFEAGELIGKNIRILIPEPQDAEHDNYLVRYIRSGEAGAIGRAQELPALRRDGTGFPIELNVAEIRVGGTRRVAAIIRDVTERRRTEQALRDSAEQLRLFADNVPAMTVAYDENLRCRFANKAFAGFFGFAVENILGKHLREVVGDAAYPEIEGHFVQVLRGHPVTYQRAHKLTNGERRYLEVKLLPHIGNQGAVLGCFAVTADITEHKLAEERIQRVAHHDSLTDLPNRLLFDDRLAQAISLAKRDSRQFALLYLDLDRFKPVNDTLGHSAGDELLQAVAARIRSQVRESDTVARVGGDEFAVILPDIARREEAEIVARKIIAAIAVPFQLGSPKQSVDIGTSIGIALYPADAQGADVLIRAADGAMYSAKQVGGSFRFCEG